jgi:hypothetical protein
MVGCSNLASLVGIYAEMATEYILPMWLIEFSELATSSSRAD